MARKPTQPAMYELLRPTPQRALPHGTSGQHGTYGAATPTAGGIHVGSHGGAMGGGPSGSAAAPQLQPTAGELHGGAPVGPGRFLKIPVGYAYVAIAVALAAVVVVYIYGFSSGESAASKRFEQRRIEELNAQSNLPAYDPMNAGKRPPSLQNDGGGPSGSNSGTSTPANQPAQQPTNQQSGGTGGQDLGPAPGGDPRQVGLNYFVLAHVAARNGEPMVDFCRKNGLDAHLVPDDNGELRLVVVCPGFQGGERQSASVKALETKIRSVGLKWKSAARGNRDFGDLYPKKHK
jgi:hypothetical protein